MLLLTTLPMEAQFAKPLKNSRVNESRNNLPISLGITGSYGWNDMLYSAVKEAKAVGYHGPTGGLAVEYNAFKTLAVGLDASYAMRGFRKATSTLFLTSYTTTTMTHVNYEMRLKAAEVRIPVTLYLGSDDRWKPYVYLAPRVDVWLGDRICWERTYDDASYAPLVYKAALGKDNIALYDISAVAGVGICHRTLIGHMQMFVKLDVSYGLSVLSNFSKSEVEAANAAHSEATAQDPFVFHGWGDIAHEELGWRRLQNVEARLTLLIPLRNHLKDACAFEQQMKIGK